MQMTISNSGIDIYLITDVSCILLLLHVLQKLKISVGSEDEIKFFRKMILSFFVYVLMDALMVFFMESLAVFPPAACCVISALDEISLAAVGLYWFLFGTTRLGYACSDSVRFRMLAAIPFAAVVVFSVTSPFTGLLFRISPEGVYSRGPLFAVQAGITFLYNLSVPVLAVIRSARTKSPSERDKAISLIKFVVAPLCSGIIQWINPNTPILCLGLVLGIYYVFIDILDMQIFNDALTGLNNRRRAERYLTECIDMVSAEKHLYVSHDRCGPL
jgi:hypothetical protein